jgi:hypothetical protein
MGGIGRDIHSVRLFSFFLNWDLAVLIQSDCGFNGIFILIIFENQGLLMGFESGKPGEKFGGSARNVMTRWPCRWALGRWAFCFGEDVDFTEETEMSFNQQEQRCCQVFLKRNIRKVGSTSTKKGVQQTCLLQTENVDFIDEEHGDFHQPTMGMGALH